MSLKIIMDVGVGKLSEEWLSQQGHDVLAMRDINPRMPDDEILEIAVREGRLVITMDKDFGELVYKHKAAQPEFFSCVWRMQPALEKLKSSSKYFFSMGTSCLGVSVFIRMGGCESTHDKTVISPQYLSQHN